MSGIYKDKNYFKNYYKRNRELLINRANVWKENNLKRRLKNDKIYKKSITGRYASYKSNAKVRGLVFELTLQEFKEMIEQDCHYCQDPGYGIDRVDSGMGYIIGNVVSCCTMCNRMKLNYEIDEFIEQCRKIVEHHLGIEKDG